MKDASRGEALHRRALRLEWFTVLWNVIEAGVAIVAGVITGSTALVAFGADSLIEVTSAIGLLWRLYRAKAGSSSEATPAAARNRGLRADRFPLLSTPSRIKASVVTRGSFPGRYYTSPLPALE
jgi:hypothetical protein